MLSVTSIESCVFYSEYSGKYRNLEFSLTSIEIFVLSEGSIEIFV